MGGGEGVYSVYLNEEPTPEEFIKKNNIPVKINGKDIRYKDIIYFENNNLEISFKPEKTKENTEVNFNEEILARYEDENNLLILKPEEVNDTSWFFLNLPESKHSYMHEVRFSDGTSEYKINLRQTAKLNEGVIIVFIEHR